MLPVEEQFLLAVVALGLRGQQPGTGAHHYERRLSKTLTCQFKGRLLVVITLPEQPRYALRAQPVKVIEHLSDALELLWGAEALPLKTFERHQCVFR